MSRTLKDVKVVGGPPPTETLSFRIKSDMRQELDLIAEYDHANVATDLVRAWVMDRVSAYSNNPRYLNWKKERAKKLEEEERKHRQGRLE